MKNLKKGAVLVALIAASQLYAQPASPTDPKSATSPARIQTMSPEEMRAEGTQLEVRVRIDTQHVLHLQSVARKEKDVIKLSCVNDKAIKQKAEANLFDNALRDFTAGSDSEQRFDLFRQVAHGSDAVHVLREEADRCVGEPELTNESGNTFTPPVIPDDPTSGLPFDDHGTVIEPPASASPYS